MNRRRWFLFIFSVFALWPPLMTLLYYLSINNNLIAGKNLVITLVSVWICVLAKRLLGFRSDLFMSVNRTQLQAFSQLINEYGSAPEIKRFVSYIDNEDRLPFVAEYESLASYCNTLGSNFDNNYKRDA